MAISIKGINTGVIRQNNEFIALALKIKEPRNKTSLFFLSPLGLRDLLIAPKAGYPSNISLAKKSMRNMRRNAIKSAKRCTEIFL